jgi:ElaA protein
MLSCPNVNQDLMKNIQENQHPSELSWQWLQLAQMSQQQLYRLLAFRESIFVVEQACPYQELDGRDELAWHLLGERSGHVLACLRVLLPPSGNKRYRIGRVAVDESARGKGLAREMLLMAEQRVSEADDSAEIVLDAQSYLLPFYQAMGYALNGDEFLEDGIPHRPMIKQLQPI